jgi:hypothetical protein
MAFYTPEQDAAGLIHTGNAGQGIPNVLLIGDSISIGYTEPVRGILTGCSNIHRPDANCGDTRNGLANIHSWLDDRIWDLIHFNWGLHDLCYRHPEATVYGNRDKVNGMISVEPAIYKANLEELVLIMQHKAKRLVWASTTYIPGGEAGRHQGDEVRYNALANEIMEENEIHTDDLYEITRAFPSEMFTCPGDVHYTKDGCNRIAEAVSQCIRAQLTKRCSTTR